MVSSFISKLLPSLFSNRKHHHHLFPLSMPPPMSSSRSTTDSPVTPPLTRSHLPPWRTSANNAQRMELFCSLAAPPSDAPDSLIPLNDVQIGYCCDALKQLTEKIKVSGGGRRRIDKEFDSLLSDRMQLKDLMARTTVARLPVNRCKNRYLDVLPYDHSRVILDVSPNDSEATSYINASYLMDAVHGSLPIFIATQGPLKNTIADFWEMAIQQRCAVIVMLTCLVDGNIVKCDSYFPVQPQRSQVYGRIKVTNKSLTISESSIATLLLEIQYIQSAEPPLPVLLLQYLDWPDHGVPATTLPVRELFRMLYRIPSTFGPFVIHCSAGIGRTGVLCTTDHTLRRILLGDLSAVDIINTVQQFRQQRIGMVQTREQYEYCYQAVIDGLRNMISKQGIW